MSNITQVVKQDKYLTTLNRGVMTSGLNQVLSGTGPFTLFAPSDLAFGKLEGGLFEGLLKAENKLQLADLLNHLARALENRKTVRVTVKITGNEKVSLPENVQLAFYRIAQESLNNIAKHGQATQARIRLHYAQNHVEMIVVDNGDGFDVSAASSGFGLNSMRERADGVGADLHIQSRLATGTKITLRWKVPVPTP